MTPGWFLVRFARSTLPEGSEARKAIDSFHFVFLVLPSIVITLLAVVIGVAVSFSPPDWTLSESGRQVIGVIAGIVVCGCAIALVINAIRGIIRSRQRYLAYEAMLQAEQEAGPTQQ